MVARSFARSVLVAFLAAALVGGVWLALRRHHMPGISQSHQGLPTDPWMYVPASTRGVVLVDVARLRSSPRLGRFFSGPGTGCEQSLARGVRSLVVVVPSFPVEAFAFAAIGDLPRDALIACAASHGEHRNEVVHESYRGYDLARVVARHEGDAAQATPLSEVVYLPGGVVLAGNGPLVRRMLDEGIAASRGAHRDLSAGLGTLRRKIAGTRTVQAAAFMPDDRGTDPIEAHVTGVSVGADADDMLDGEAVLMCDDVSGADATAQALESARSGAGERMVVPALAGLMAGAAIAPRGSEVHVRFSLGASAFDALLATAEGMLRAQVGDQRASGPRDQ